MESSESVQPTKSIERTLPGWLQDFLQNPPFIPLDQVEMLCRWDKILESVPKDSALRNILNFILLQSRNRHILPNGLEFLRDTLPCMEALRKSKHWDTLASFVTFAWNLWEKENKRIVREKNKQKTQEANRARKNKKVLKNEIVLLALESKLQQADCAVHKKKENGEFYIKNNIKQNLRAFCRKNEQEITEILEKCRIHENYLTFFPKMYSIYRDAYISQYERTYCGYEPEQRAPRSEESRKRSSQGALNTKHAKKLIKKKQKKTK